MHNLQPQPGSPGDPSASARAVDVAKRFAFFGAGGRKGGRRASTHTIQALHQHHRHHRSLQSQRRLRNPRHVSRHKQPQLRPIERLTGHLMEQQHTLGAHARSMAELIFRKSAMLPERMIKTTLLTVSCVTALLLSAIAYLVSIREELREYLHRNNVAYGTSSVRRFCSRYLQSSLFNYSGNGVMNRLASKAAGNFEKASLSMDDFFSEHATCATETTTTVPPALQRTVLDVDVPLNVAQLRAALFQSGSSFFDAWFQHIDGISMECEDWKYKLASDTSKAGDGGVKFASRAPVFGSLSQELNGHINTKAPEGDPRFEGVGLQRMLHFVTATKRTRKGTMLSTEEQTVVINQPERGVVIVESLIDPGPQVPFGSCFRVQEQWALLANGADSTSRIRVSVQVKWLKTCPLKPIINRAVHAQVHNTLSKFEDFVKQQQIEQQQTIFNSTVVPCYEI